MPVRTRFQRARLLGVSENTMKKLLVILLLAPSLADACSFARGWNHFLVEPRHEAEETKPKLPKLEVSEVRRGYNDGNYASCSDAGIITFKAANTPIGEFGYTFEIEEGEFEGSVFPKGALAPLENGEIFFVWLDGSKNYQEAFDLSVRVHSVNKQGIYSDSVFIQISHAGGEIR